ncbi:hypothetical protein L1987_74369 [Smallanthus sonchifolius]|uniref:Uncharacterized protein n=1 Tax=Smallanthus sonchifolius TaxID=185202 RepID=A0ACB9A3D5_9ASTR|nr:hypothetical protein L1987_74369 [Smallanthus sonchifolius]
MTEWKSVMGEDEEYTHPLSTPQIANETNAEVSIATPTSAIVTYEAEAEASNKGKWKGIMTDEEEKKIEEEKKEVERRKREREEMAELKKAQERKEQLNKKDEEKERKKAEDAKFRITDSELAKEMREEWIAVLISQGEDADYLEKLSNKEIYRAFMGQQGELANKKGLKKKKKPDRNLGKPLPSKARGESGKRLGPMSFMNLQALYRKVEKEEERLKKTDQWFEVFRGKAEMNRSIYKSVDEVVQLPDLDLKKILELGEAHEPDNESERHLLLVIKHHFNPSKDAIFSMPRRDIKSLSEIPFDNPIRDPRGYETARIVLNMQKLQEQRQLNVAADRHISSMNFTSDNFLLQL